jgi:hypothetical protein
MKTVTTVMVNDGKSNWVRIWAFWDNYANISLDCMHR